MQEKAPVLSTSLTVHQKTYEEMYLQYVQIFNATVQDQFKLSPKECEVVAYILTQPVHHTQFRGTAFKRLLKRFRINENTARTYRRQLVEKGWVTRDKSLLNNTLTRLHTALTDKTVSEISFNINIVLNER